MLNFSSLRLRLPAGFIGVALILLVPCVYALISLGTLGERFRATYSEAVKPVQQWGDVRTEIASAISLVSYHVAEMNPDRMAKGEALSMQHLRQADKLMEEMKGLEGAAEVTEKWSKLRHIIESCLDQSKKFLKIQADAGIKSEEAVELSSRLSELLKARLAAAATQLDEYRALSLTLNSRLKTQVTLAAGAAFFVALAVGLLLSKSIVRPVKDLAGVADQVSEGNLGVQIPGQDRDDELGTLARSFDRMLGSMRGQMRLQEASAILATAVPEIATIISQVAATANQTFTAISETSTTVEEARQSADLSSQKARAVAETADKAAKAFLSGRTATEETVEGIHKIKDRMESIRKAVQELHEQSDAVGNLMGSVQDIADQSNVLAVNASIEAARAGDQGKGFAVVSKEIKTLSDQSRNSANEVRSILEGTRQRINSVLMATEEGAKVVDACLSQASVAGDSLNHLADSVSSSAQAASIIDASSGQQVLGLDHIVVAMRSIEQASRGTLEGMTKLEEASEQLSELGNNLKQLVEHYKL